MRTRALSLLLSGLLFGCSASTADPAPASTTAQQSGDCPDGTDLTYENFGAPFMRSWCNGCHSVALEGPARKNAPASVSFESLADVKKHSARILARAAGQVPTMPPAGGAPAIERKRLAEWLSCGAPGIDKPRETPPSRPVETGGGDRACANVAAFPDPTSARCSVETRDCIAKCYGKDYGDCANECMAADTTPKDATTGFDCTICIQTQLLKCVDRNGCHDAVGAALCCREGCTGSACDEPCARAQEGLEFCVGYVTPQCYDFGGTAMAKCFSP